MRGRPLPLLIACLFALAATPGCSTDDPYDTGDIPIDVYICEDPDGVYSIEDVEQMPWERLAPGEANLGLGVRQAWLRVSLINAPPLLEPLVLSVAYAQLDSVEVFASDHLEIGRSGDSFPFYERDIDSPFPAFKIYDPKQRTLYLRVRTLGPFNIPVTLQSERSFLRDRYRTDLLFGSYFGGLLLVVALNALLFLSIRDSAFGWYSLYVALLALTMFAFRGYSFQYLWPDYPDWQHRAFVVTALLYQAPALVFSSRYLGLKALLPRVHRAFVLLALYFLGFALFAVFGPYEWLSRLANPSVMGSSILILAVALYVTLKGYKAANYFLAAWLFFLSGQLVAALWFLSILPHHPLIANYPYIGSALEVVLLSLGLGYRFNQQKQDSLDQQAKLTQSYARFVPMQFLEYLNKESITQVALGDAVEREMTVLFSDIRSYTTLSEKMTPTENFDFLNGLLRRTGPLIREHDGFIDKYIGDAIMALFPQRAEDAVRASIALRKLLHAYNLRRNAQGLEAIDTGIGINTGRLILGTIGEDERMEGTVISDAVNLASRMEGLTKMYGAGAVMSEQTLFRMENPDQYHFRILDRVKVKGKKDPVSVFEILDGEPGDVLDRRMSTRQEFERGLNAYQSGRFNDAQALFEQVNLKDPGDLAARMYIARSVHFATHGVPPDWEGVEILDQK